MKAEPSIAVLMTCYNRRDLTLACLKALRIQRYFQEANLFLVDDGSSDGTREAVLREMPQANVIRGTGSLYWNGGMRLAWASAKASGNRFDFYLWLNDDVRLAPNALDMMITDAGIIAPDRGAVIIVAATTEPGSANMTYGGHRRLDPRRPLRLSIIAPQGVPVPVDTVSGNIVMVSEAAEEVLGNMLPAFEHIYGDLDYGFRACMAGVPVALASGYGGTCAANPLDGSSLDPKLSRIARLRRRWSEDEKVHARDWRRFVALHAGGGMLTRLGYRAMPYLRILFQRPNPAKAIELTKR